MSTNAHSEQTLAGAASFPLNYCLAWYALTVRPRHEKSVARNLAGKGYETFVPLYSQLAEGRPGTAKRTRVSELPLFPGIVFSRFDIHKRLPILVTPGVLRILGGETPVRIDATEVESLRIATQQSFSARPFPFLEGGHRVQIADGPLSGVEGVVVRLKGSVRVILSVASLQRSVMVELGDSALATFDARAKRGAL